MSKKEERRWKHVDVADLHVHIAAFIKPNFSEGRLGSPAALYVQAWDNDGHRVTISEYEGPQEARDAAAAQRTGKP